MRDLTEIIDINEDNINKYGLFCKKTKKKEMGYQNKVAWIKERLKEGLKYKLLWVTEGYKKPTSRGFIEYIPGEYNWRGINASNWMVIHCLWITGRVKKQGFGKKLLNEAIKDAKKQHLDGVAVVVSQKCSGLAKDLIFMKAGFEKVDECSPNFELYALKFSKKATTPKFNPIKKQSIEACGNGVTLLYAHQCPYIPDVINPVKKYANSENIPFQVKNITTSREAQNNNISPYGVYGIAFNNEVISYCFPKSVSQITEMIKKEMH
ncbi:MAG: hypothetical protein BAJALOKI1v1_190017 [Promethearchaeota archaeon]|nr:MAG: hypothetical protein BAJALOKI1v1_190017 [Candidatus Lokiarchaeota archaeon]